MSLEHPPVGVASLEHRTSLEQLDDDSPNQGTPQPKPGCTIMNRHVDERITFSYPADLRCTRHSKSNSYHLRRGSLHVFITLPELEHWQSVYDLARGMAQFPKASVDSSGETVRTNQGRVEDFSRYQFQGIAGSLLCRGPGDIVENEERLCEQAKHAAFRYYTEQIHPLVSSLIGRNDKLRPVCHSAEEVMPLIKLSSLLVHEPREDGAVPIGLRFSCSWDLEHGLGLRAVARRSRLSVPTQWPSIADAKEWPEFQSPAGESAD